MASTRIRTRSDGSHYTAVLFREDGAQRSLSFDDHAEALRLCKLINSYGPAEARRIHGINQDAAGRGEQALTVAVFLNAHIDGLTGVEQATRSKYRYHVRTSIAPAFGDVPLVALDRDEHIRPWVRAMTASAKTQALRLTFLSGALNAAVDAKLIHANPAHGVRTQKGERREPVFLTPDEFRQIRDNMPPEWRPLATWLATTGTRPGEALALRVGDIDMRSHTARIRRAKKSGTAAETRTAAPKSKAGIRTINVPASTLAMLDLDRPTKELVFTHPTKGGPVTLMAFYYNAWKPATTAAGWADDQRPRTYDLRHSNASWMLNAGIPLFVVSRHLGHASIKITADTYGHLDRSVAKTGADAIGKMLEG